MIPLPDAPRVIPRAVEEEAIAPLVNDQPAPPLENVEVNWWEMNSSGEERR